MALLCTCFRLTVAAVFVLVGGCGEPRPEHEVSDPSAPSEGMGDTSSDPSPADSMSTAEPTDDDDGAGDDDDAGGTTAESGGQTGDSSTGESSGDDDDGEEPDVTDPLRRLNALEYGNSVADVFGIELALDLSAWTAEPTLTGFDNDASQLYTSPAHVLQYMDAAARVADAVEAAIVDDPTSLLPCDPATVDPLECGQAFIEDLMPRAYRGMVPTGERERLQALLAAGMGVGGLERGIAMVVEAVVQAPAFLYRIEKGQSDDPTTVTPHELATRLSYFFWRSTPDAALLAVAESGALADVAEIEAQARRLLASERARVMIERFHDEWLVLDDLVGAEKEPSLYPKWERGVTDVELLSATRRFVEHVVLDQGGSLADLLRSNEAFVNDTIAWLYGLDEPLGDELVLREFPGLHAGIIADPGMMAARAGAVLTSPVGRGKFVREQLMCQTLTPPPPGLDINVPEPDPTLTTRELFERHRADHLCASCHALTDTMGFAFENYDAAGAYRTIENSLPIDASGEIIDGGDFEGLFEGALELADIMATDSVVRACYATQWYRFAFGRPEAETDAPALAELAQGLEGDAAAQDLFVRVATSEAFRSRKPDRARRSWR